MATAAAATSGRGGLPGAASNRSMLRRHGVEDNLEPTEGGRACPGPSRPAQASEREAELAALDPFRANREAGSGLPAGRPASIGPPAGRPASIGPPAGRSASISPADAATVGVRSPAAALRVPAACGAPAPLLCQRHVGGPVQPPVAGKPAAFDDRRRLHERLTPRFG